MRISSSTAWRSATDAHGLALWCDADEGAGLTSVGTAIGGVVISIGLRGGAVAVGAAPPPADARRAFESSPRHLTSSSALRGHARGAVSRRARANERRASRAFAHLGRRVYDTLNSLLLQNGHAVCRRGGRTCRKHSLQMGWWQHVVVFTRG